MNLKSLCSPVLALMRRMTYGRLFTLVGAALVLPMVLLLFLQVSATNARIEFNQKEVYGVDNIEPARQLLREVGMRRLQLAAQSRGVEGLSDMINTSGTRIGTLLTEVTKVTGKFATELATVTGEQKTVQRAQDLQLAWQNLEQNTGGNAARLDDAYRDFESTINDFILNYVGNYSNLILDPDLDSYWLMDSYTARLPGLAASLTDIIYQAMTKTVNGRLSDTDRLTLSGELRVARDATGTLRTNLQTAYDNTTNAKLKPALDEPARLALAELDNFLGLMQVEFLGTEEATLRTDDLLTMALSVVAKNDDLYGKVAPELASLIQVRVDSYHGQRLAGLAAGLFALLLVVYIMLSFYFQVATELTGKIREAEDLRNRAETETQSLNGNIMDLLTFVADCADGDLTNRAKVTEGALGNVADALNQMMDNWSQVLGTQLKSIEETNDAGRRIGEAADSMTQGANAQVQKLEDATNAVQMIRGNITNVSDNAATAVTAASRTQESAFNGSEMVQKIAVEMDTLRANVQAGAKKIKNLGDRSMEITGIVGTIAKISEQTNMLALNAAIEAARAGEHGRGFSVVAEEVRKLAERTSSATQDIRGLITSIQAETSESVAAIEEQTRAVEHHAESVAMSGEVLQKIQHESTQTSELIADMNRTAKNQVPVAEKTLQGMVAVSEIARSTQETAQETLKLAQELGATSNRLVAAVSSFRISTN